MPKRDPREVLGVHKRAGTAKCQRAYRKLVMELHPDRNPGDDSVRARFEEVQDAWDRLNGKGDTDARLMDGKVVANLCGLFVQVTGEVLGTGGEPCERDLKAVMRTKLIDHKKTVADKIKEITKQRAKIAKLCGRWRAGDDETPLESVLRAKLADADAVLAGAEIERDLVEGSLAMLDSWTFRADKPQQASLADLLRATCAAATTERYMWKTG